MEIVPEPEWEALLESLSRHKGTAMLLGATDSGKSTLARYLVKRLVSENIKVSVVDSDVGQASIGLPGTISMKAFRNLRDIENFRYERMSFVGTINPATKIPLMIGVTKRMVEVSKEKSDITVVDTTGLISGEIGKALKIGKIRVVKPGHIIAVQRSGELEHILSLVENITIHRIRPSRSARSRSREYRFRYRRKKFDDYFKDADLAEFLLYLNDAEFFYNGKSFSPKEKDFKEGAIVGLNHNDTTIALGIIIEVAKSSITFRSPIKSLNKINRVVLGDIVIQR